MRIVITWINLLLFTSGLLTRSYAQNSCSDTAMSNLGLSSQLLAEPEVEVTVAYLEDPLHKYIINTIVNQNFTIVSTRSELNFGFSKSNYWVRLQFKKLTPRARYKIALKTIINDSIEVYEQSQNTFVKTFIGEAFPSSARYQFYSFVPLTENSTIYFKIIGRDHPIALPFAVAPAEEIDKQELNELLLLGFVYGIVGLILLLNLVLFLNTQGRIYWYSMLFNLFSLGVLFYFDGIFKFFFFTDSLYWNNQSIAISFCGSFIFTNYFIVEFLNLRKHSKTLPLYFMLLNVLFFGILVVSFWHPLGYNWYLKINLVLTSVEVVLLSYSILYIRKKEEQYFTIQLVSVICLNLFGTIAQLYFSGILPLNFITVHSVHFVVLPQIIIQAAALGKRFSILIKQQASLSKSLQESSEEYARSLINTIEEERRRLSKDFHDSIGQNLLVIRNGMLRIRKDELARKHIEKLTELIGITSDTLDEIRSISQNLRPTMLDSIGLTASIESMTRKLNTVSDTVFVLECPHSIDNIVPKDLEINVYRILQELTNNIIKHSNAKNALISILQDGETLYVCVKDDGVGFDVNFKDDSSPHNGLSAIKERTHILKGKLSLNTAINQGTTTTFLIPVFA